MSDRTPDRMSGYMSDRLPDKMPEHMSDRMTYICQIERQKKQSDKLSVYIEYLSKYTS